MNNKCIKIVCTLMMFIVLTGCEKSVKQDDVGLAKEPLAEMLALPSEFASQALEQTGGLEAWGKVRQLRLDCIVTFYNKDAGYYLTEQRYEIYPWSNSVVVSGKESKDSYKWQLSKGKFDILEGTGQLRNFNNQIDSGCFAEAILNLVTAPTKFLDKSMVYTRDTTDVNIQGRWCYPITMNPAGGSVSSASVNNTVFYQNRAGSLVDMILMTCGGDNASFLVCGYDYKKVKGKDVSVPNRIEIHLAGKDNISQRQLFRIDVSSVK
ncbi:MAG: hypothetical protein JW787_16635 [Sedimentisphaerales bacterium]|nr:hypothetical protein [Sedimentisphaerales bacterium]